MVPAVRGVGVWLRPAGVVLGERQLAMAAAAKRKRGAGGGDAEYEDYDATSQTYDSVRRCVGLASLERALATSSRGVGKPLAELQLLDVGCGTGNYIAAVKSKLARCVGLDPSQGMIKQARAKHGSDPRVTLQQASVLDIPFSDCSFDVVIMTQVLHHLAPDTHSTALAEIARVLRPGGACWISTQTPHQHMEGFWWTPLIPRVTARSRPAPIAVDSTRLARGARLSSPAPAWWCAPVGRQRQLSPHGSQDSPNSRRSSRRPAFARCRGRCQTSHCWPLKRELTPAGRSADYHPPCLRHTCEPVCIERFAACLGTWT